MGMTRFLTIGTIALATLSQTGWGQKGGDRVEALHAHEGAFDNSRTQQSQPPAVQQTPSSSELISINFPGGTIAEYVAALREVSPVVNIVVSPEAAGIQAPEVILRNVTLGVAAAAVEFQRETAGEWNQWEAVQVEPLDHREDNRTSAFRVVYRRSTQSIPSMAKQDASAWTVADLLSNGYQPDEVLAAIQVGQELFGESATIKYHEPTKLLVARGTSEQLGLISRTLDQLRIGRPVDTRAAALRKQIAGWEARAMEVDAELQPLQTRLVDLRRDLESDTAQARRYTSEARARIEIEIASLEQDRNKLLDQRNNLDRAIQQAHHELESLRQLP